jgi:hypothetical protein
MAGGSHLSARAAVEAHAQRAGAGPKAEPGCGLMRRARGLACAAAVGLPRLLGWACCEAKAN